MLKIKNLTVESEGKVLLKDLTINIERGQIHVIMGPNGAGKSTLSKVIAGHPKYEVKGGQIFYNGEDLLQLTPEQRALKGIFVSFQYPIEINGISNFEFLFASYKARKKANEEKNLCCREFEELLSKELDKLDMKKEFIKRNVNEGFSGGEKKKNEILQMALFSPQLSVLDEIDSGLDVDALKIISKRLKSLKNENNSYVLITHYQRFLDYITPDFVHVLHQGSVIKSGDASLAREIEKKGYDWLLQGTR